MPFYSVVRRRPSAQLGDGHHLTLLKKYVIILKKDKFMSALTLVAN